MPGFPFGLTAAVTYFNALTELTASAARRLLGLPTDKYFDDFDVTTLAGLGEASQAALGRLHELCGFPFSAKKHVPCAASNKFLGVITDFARLAQEGVVEVKVGEERKAKISRELRQVLVRGTCTPATAPGTVRASQGGF